MFRTIPWVFQEIPDHSNLMDMVAIGHTSNIIAQLSTPISPIPFPHKHAIIKYMPRFRIKSYTLIGIGDFSHGNINIWKYRINMLKRIIKTTGKQITIFIQDTKTHTNNIMKKKRIRFNKNAKIWWPLKRYARRFYDSPIYLEFIRYIQNNRKRIKIIGVDNQEHNRDQSMAQEILENLDHDKINFFYAHNTHVDNRQITEPYEKGLNTDKYRCGHYLKLALDKKYCIILSTAYKGKLRFDSTCFDELCIDRKIFIKPTFEQFVIPSYQGFYPGLHYEFKNQIAEWTACVFPDNSPNMVDGNPDFVMFFQAVDPLPLYIIK